MTRSTPRRTRRPPRKYVPEVSPTETGTAEANANDVASEKKAATPNKSPQRSRRPRPLKHQSESDERAESTETEKKDSINSVSEEKKQSPAELTEKYPKSTLEPVASKSDTTDESHITTVTKSEMEEKDTATTTNVTSSFSRVDTDKVANGNEGDGEEKLISPRKRQKGNHTAVQAVAKELLPACTANVATNANTSVVLSILSKNGPQSTKSQAEQAASALSSFSLPVTASAGPTQTAPPTSQISILDRYLERLASNDAYFTHVDLSRRPLDMAYLDRFVPAVSNHCAIKKLVLSDCMIGDDGVKLLINARLATTESLWLDGNGIGPEGAKSIATSWQSNAPLLKRLFLPFNKMGPIGASAIARSLMGRPYSCLEALDVGENEIGNEGALAFGHMLSQSKSRNLKELYLYGNSIGNDGAAAIAAGLRNNTFLEELDLRYNEITNDGASALGSALNKQNTTLRSLAVVGNKIEGEGKGALLARRGLAVIYYGSDVLP